MTTLYHPTIPDVTTDVADSQLEEAEKQGWLAEAPNYEESDVTVERLGDAAPATGGFVDRTAALTKPAPTGPGAAQPEADKS